MVLHAGPRAGGLVLWGERPVGEAARPARRPGRKPRIPRPAPHPFGAAATDLEAALGTVSGTPSGQRRARSAEALVAWLPSTGGAPTASSPLIAPPAEGTPPVALAPWTV